MVWFAPVPRSSGGRSAVSSSSGTPDSSASITAGWKLAAARARGAQHGDRPAARLGQAEGQERG